MAGVTAAEREQVFKNLAQNGLDFIARSAAELTDAPKFSVAHFATGVELILKARLFTEHWTLISTTPHASPWSQIKDGSVQTLNASDLCAAIINTTGDHLQHESAAFKAVFDHRNRVLHWVPGNDLGAIAAEQCLAWFYLHELLRKRWHEHFAAFSLAIGKVEVALRKHGEYLRARYKAKEARFKGLAHTGAAIVCPACEYVALVLKDPSERVSSAECEVCGFAQTMLRPECDRWIEVTDLETECQCGSHHGRDDFGSFIDPPGPPPAPGDPPEDTDGTYCGECFEAEPHVHSYPKGYVCLDCGSLFSTTSTCGYCGATWAGWNSEHSGIAGCGNCRGHVDDS